MSRTPILSVIIFVYLQLTLISITTADTDRPYISNIEMYGTSEELASHLMKKYEKRLKTLAQAMLPNSDKPDGMENYDLGKQMYHSIIDDIMNEGDFSYVNISNIFYPAEKTTYMTIDVVNKSDNQIRNNFSQLPSKNIKDKSGLITEWLGYEKKGWEMYLKGEINLDMTDCPVYHCVFGFENKAFQNYLSKFNTAEKYEKEIVDMLSHDANPEKRAAAAFLIGHFNNPKKIIEILTPTLTDPDDKVRNDALRVIISTFLKAEDKNLSIPINKIIKAINDPSAADRGKALLILYEVVKRNKKYHQDVKANAGHILVNLLKLKQPSNHDGAYMVLKEISGEYYDEWDISSWEKWVNKG